MRLKSGSISFKNYFKQLPVPFKIYADFECILRKVKSDFIECDFKIVHTQENIKIMFLVVLLIRLFVLTINSVKKLFFTEEEMLFTNSLNQLLVSIVVAEK